MENFMENCTYLFEYYTNVEIKEKKIRLFER